MKTPLGYIREYAVGVRGRIRNYKIDFALPSEKIAIEFDGQSHRGKIRKQQDLRKTKVLKSLSWKAIRVPHD